MSNVAGPVVVLLGLLALLPRESLGNPALQTSVEPSPPYAPGTVVRVRVSGKGMSQLMERAHFRLLGRGSTDFINTDTVVASGNPPAWEWTFTAPAIANTRTPRLEVGIQYKNGVHQDMDAANTPALGSLRFTGIQVDAKKPVLSNLRFSRPEAGKARVEYDAFDPSGFESHGGGCYINGLRIAGEWTECQGQAPRFHCVTEVEIPPQSRGTIRFQVGFGDGAGNRLELDRSFALPGPASDPSRPEVAWPAVAQVCPDRNVRISIKTRGGGGGIFDGVVSIRSGNDYTHVASPGPVEVGSLRCSGRDCETSFPVPELVGLARGALDASVGGRSSRSGVGGVSPEGHYVEVRLTGNSGIETTYRLPPSATRALASVPEGSQCRRVELSPAGTRVVAPGGGAAGAQ
jgi:hypothetical protein